MGTCSVGPAILARARCASNAAVVGAGRVVGASASSATIVASLLSVGVDGSSAQRCHHFLHLGQKSCFSGRERDLSLSDDSVDCVVGDHGLGWRGRHGFKETLCYEISHGGHRICLMENITCGREGGEILLGLSEVGDHVGPCALDNRHAVPAAEILL